jgi:hypothetical protein
MGAAEPDPALSPRRPILRCRGGPAPTIEEAALAASCLDALSGFGQADAAQVRRAMAERATRRRGARGVA